MGATKKHFYPSHQLKLAEIYKALGHPARITLVQQILNESNCNCTTLGQFLQLSSSNISQHLQVLHRAGITGYEVIGSNCIYHVNPAAIELLTDNISLLEHQAQSLGENVYCPSV